MDRDSLGGWPTPLVYQIPFQRRPNYMELHWHWFWSSADRLQVIRPPAPGAEASVCVGPAVIDALAQALVADLLSETTVGENREELR
ncbi:MAG: hypothetical protein DME01_14235 [Candidatus Rokuibacteriota bacterium]|nr:MAG: hypothetical protein DME01_14235 [Candidatus Rokubacteria bacterium]